MIYKTGILTSHVKKTNPDEEDGIYEMYYDYQERVKYIASHRVLAINRAEKEKVLTVSIEIDDERFIQYIVQGVMRRRESSLQGFIEETVKDAFKRLIFPSVEREIRHELTEKAQEQAYDILVVSALDRLGRDLWLTMGFVRELLRMGIRIIDLSWGSEITEWDIEQADNLLKAISK